MSIDIVKLTDFVIPEATAPDRNDRDPPSRRSRRSRGWEIMRGKPDDASIETYREHELRELLERVREGFAMLDAGEIDAFALDELIARYRNGALALHEFCDSHSLQPQRAASTLAALREQGAQPDWWRAGERPISTQGS